MQVVLLHGHSGQPSSLAEVAEALTASSKRSEPYGVRVVPGPVRLAGGFAWWDAGHLEYPDPAAALGWLRAQLDDEPTVLVGFSQGAALALLAAHARWSNVIGVAAVAGFLPPDADVASSSGLPPIFLAHGEADEVVDAFHTEALARRLARSGTKVEVVLHPGGHEWVPEVTAALVKWVNLRFGVE